MRDRLRNRIEPVVVRALLLPGASAHCTLWPVCPTTVTRANELWPLDTFSTELLSLLWRARKANCFLCCARCERSAFAVAVAAANSGTELSEQGDHRCSQLADSAVIVWWPSWKPQQPSNSFSRRGQSVMHVLLADSSEEHAMACGNYCFWSRGRWQLFILDSSNGTTRAMLLKQGDSLCKL